MPGDTTIEWTHIELPDGRRYRGVSWNAATGGNCQVSPGCDHCYAHTFAERWRGIPGHPYEQGFDLRLWPERLELPLRWKQPRGIFVNSMSDWCLDEISDEFILKMFDTMLQADWHIYQLLTKRAPRMVRLIPQITERVRYHTGKTTWPEHLWFGVTVESYAQRGRIRHLERMPSAIQFISYEPALSSLGDISLTSINWLICGAESGQGARPMPVEWAREARDLCQRDGVSFFLKQFATPSGKKIPLPELDGRQWKEYPVL